MSAEYVPAISPVVDLAPVSTEQMKNQVQAIQLAMRDVMIEGTHFGVIPGTGDKPALLKAGAEKIGMLFRIFASFEIGRDDLPGLHREYIITCTLKDSRGVVVGQGLGSCSTMESKYRYRIGARKCPKCGKDTITKGKEEFGGGWFCFAKKGGCGAKFGDADTAITQQQIGQIENKDIADVYNTVLKMAKKRAHVDAILTATAASDIFTQDVEDNLPIDAEYREVRREDPKQAPQQKKVVETQPQPVEGSRFYDFSSPGPLSQRELDEWLNGGQKILTWNQQRGLWESKRPIEKFSAYAVLADSAPEPIPEPKPEPEVINADELSAREMVEKMKEEKNATRQ
jgi:hypothetical protein